MKGVIIVTDEPERKEVDMTGDDGLVERVVYVKNPDGSWMRFGQCPKCGDVNACVCDRTGDET
jgi:hypothetical protein